MSLDPTGLYWLLSSPLAPPATKPSWTHDEPSDPRGMLNTISSHLSLLLTILLALPCNVHPWQPSALPSTPSTARQLEVTPGGSIRGGKSCHGRTQQPSQPFKWWTNLPLICLHFFFLFFPAHFAFVKKSNSKDLSLARTGISRRKYKDWGGHLGRKRNHQVQNGFN